VQPIAHKRSLQQWARDFFQSATLPWRPHQVNHFIAPADDRLQKWARPLSGLTQRFPVLLLLREPPCAQPHRAGTGRASREPQGQGRQEVEAGACPEGWLDQSGGHALANVETGVTAHRDQHWGLGCSGR